MNFHKSITKSSISPDVIRNVCILAHVDHGKTSLSDSLLALIGLISNRSAGTIKFLDDRKDEQERGITMKSSSVCINTVLKEDGNDQFISLNLIDTPGHIDFMTEVSAAVRICDGALIVVDVVEGVCVQTKEAIKQAYEERVKMILVINKIDRLILELHRDSREMFQAILHVIEDCNAFLGSLFCLDIEEGEDDEEKFGFYFSPDLGNVIFASSLDGWGFTTEQISKMYTKIFPNETLESINKKMWDFDCYVDFKNRIICKGAVKKNKPNLFIQLCLSTLHFIYSTIVLRMEYDRIQEIIKKLDIEATVSHSQYNDGRLKLRAVLQHWKPLAQTILLQCYRIIPSPNAMEEKKIQYLLNCEKYSDNQHIAVCLEKLITAFKKCSSDEILISYVSKMFIQNKQDLRGIAKIVIPKPRNTIKMLTTNDQTSIEESPPSFPKQENNTNNGLDKAIETEDNEFNVVALARVFSGCLTIGQEIFILNSNYDPSSIISSSEIESEEFLKNNLSVQKATIRNLYVIEGRSLQSVPIVMAGQICGIGGLENTVLRTATLTNSLMCVPLVEKQQMDPIIRSVVEPLSLGDLPKLRRGLRLLMQSDSCVQVIMQETGEHVLLTAGSVHLDKCMEDLKNKFSKIELSFSKPTVSLRETIILQRKQYDFIKDRSKFAKISLNEYGIEIIIAIVPLPEKIFEVVTTNFELLKMVENYQTRNRDMVDGRNIDEYAEDKQFVYESTRIAVNRVKKLLIDSFKEIGNVWNNLDYRNIWSISGKCDSINLLLNITPEFKNLNIFTHNTDKRIINNCIINAFNAFCKAGPICQEPLMKCGFIIGDINVSSSCNESLTNTQLQSGMTLCIKNQFCEVFEKQQQRLMEPIFATDIQVNSFALGKVYSVVHKHFGKVIEAVDMDEQEKTYVVKAEVPAVESSSLPEEIRRATSGNANPRLRFSHYEVVEGDPYYEPIPDEDGFVTVNRANKLMKDVRRRKGLQVDDQVVVSAEKQRTLNKKK
ncbi:elongation factor-like GTPase 1 isoform X1 [Agrilus planipennis]|uniref:Elongation factor-like GTPase 1 isoform X1 n=1 Tax=Agrilus planipennis TaxID=224129 RepID=A0A1W4X6A4_AGRPL|nr:elongation factor-like GTPase 1 isoform X1 [Agrilus planipennis]